MKKCIVPRSHFTGMESGLYYLYHKNSNNESIQFYESSPIKAFLSEKELYISIKRGNNKEKIKLIIKVLYLLW